MQVNGAVNTDMVSRLDVETRFILQTLTSRQAFKSDRDTYPNMDKLIHVLDSHRLSIVFYSRVNNTPFSSLFVAPPLKSEYTASKLRMLRHMAELCRIVKLFQQKNIDLISLKGPLLGQLYYDDYTERECNDLDILVKPGDLETAYQVLLNLGYTLSETLWETPKQKSLYQKTFHHYHLYNQATDIQVELHWKLFTSTIEAENIEHTIWPNSIAHHISGLHISILSSSINFIYLCVHGSTHQWKRLFWVLDIVRIIEKEGQDFIVNAYEIALESHVERCVLEGCQLAHLLFKVDLPKPIQDAIQEDTQLSKLTETSIFFINTTTLPSLSPLSSLKAFRLTVKKVVYFHQAIYLLAGSKAIYTTVKKFFINPDYWRIYSVNDKLFALNYVIAPLLWIYCLFRKHRA